LKPRKATEVWKQLISDFEIEENAAWKWAAFSFGAPGALAFRSH
jgi:hypothetical protein